MITQPRTHTAHADDIVCLVKQHIADDDVKQVLVVMPHDCRLKLRSQVPNDIEPRNKMAANMVKNWKGLAEKIAQHYPNPNYARAR
jgi:hypothetical protein